MLNNLEVAIFSYNRGKYLKNCVDSVRENLPNVKITIFDDYSDDEETIHYLNSLGDQVALGANTQGSRHGNLYKNMQLALDHSSKPFLLLLQDDLQVIRKINHHDMNTIQAIFNDPDIAFLRPQFMKLDDGKRNTELLSPSTTVRAYYPKTSFLEGTFVHAYSDVGLCHTTKLKKVSWQFADNERENQINALKIFKYMPFMADTFIFYCPEVPCYRNKKLLLASKLVQKKLKGTISRYLTFSNEKNLHFTSRDIHNWPIAEDFLETSNTSIMKPFVYQDYKKSFFLRSLYKLERAAHGINAILNLRAFKK